MAGVSQTAEACGVLESHGAPPCQHPMRGVHLIGKSHATGGGQAAVAAPRPPEWSGGIDA